MKLNVVTPFTAYRACTKGEAISPIVYFQHQAGVIEMNRRSRLVNHLPRGHLVDYGIDVEEIEVEDYLKVASEVLLENGFPFLMSRG